MENRYIILDDSKRPIEKLSDGGHTFAEVEEFANVGILIPNGFVVLDVDTRREADIILNILMGENTPCGIMLTKKGLHCWFKTTVEMKNSVKTRLAIGVRADFRSWGIKDGRPKLSYTRIKREGEWCEWLKPPKDVGEFPFWLRPVRYDGEIFADMAEGDGRNQALFNYILVLKKKLFTKEEIREVIRIINTYVFSSPLPDAELATILRDESFPADIVTKEDMGEFGRQYLTEDGIFKHNIFATALVQNMKIVTINDLTYVYENGYYRPADRGIELRMIREYPIVKQAQRAEVMDYIKIITNIRAEDIPVEEYIINCNNTRLNVRTQEMLPFTSDVIDFARLPINYDPTAYSPELDAMLKKVFKQDQEAMNLFEEMVGYLLIKNCRYRKGFLFYGSGSNGKSTILNMLKAFLGQDNVSTVELGKLSDTFLTAELQHKLANIGDDISKKEITDTGSIKKLFTGESQTVQRKYGQPFTLRAYAKLIFSCNDMPHISDRSAGMYSRLTLIPFTAVFSVTDSDFDPFIEDKVVTPIALSHLLNIALRGLSRLLHTNHFTEPESVKLAAEEYQIDNSTVLTWVEDEGVELKHLLGIATNVLYSRFADWCSRSNIRNIPSTKLFHKDIETKFELTKKRMKNLKTGGKQEWFFEVKTP